MLIKPVVKITLLGAFGVTVEGKPVARLGSKERLLLAWLAVHHRRPALRSEIAAALWPGDEDEEPRLDAEEEQYRNERRRFYLRRTLARLRKRLGIAADRLQSFDRLTLAFDFEGVDCDIIGLIHAIEAASSGTDVSAESPERRGQFMSGHDDEWVLEVRDRIDALVNEARIGLVQETARNIEQVPMFLENAGEMTAEQAFYFRLGGALYCDMQGHHFDAIALMEAFLKRQQAIPRGLEAAARMYLATFLDHERQFTTAEENLNKARSLLEEGPGCPRPDLGPEERSTYYWVVYQLGVILVERAQDPAYAPIKRRLLHRARMLLEVVRVKKHTTAAMHQLGVIDLLEGRYEQARDRFQCCLNRRGYPGEIAYRMAYDFRRLGQVYVAWRQPKNWIHEARLAFTRARDIARHFEFLRYVDLVETDISNLEEQI